MNTREALVENATKFFKGVIPEDQVDASVRLFARASDDDIAVRTDNLFNTDDPSFANCIVLINTNEALPDVIRVKMYLAVLLAQQTLAMEDAVERSARDRAAN